MRARGCSHLRIPVLMERDEPLRAPERALGEPLHLLPCCVPLEPGRGAYDDGIQQWEGVRLRLLELGLHMRGHLGD